MTGTSSDGKEMETSGQNNEGGIPYKVKAGAFLAFAGGFGLLAGFGGALAQVRGCSIILFCKNMKDISLGLCQVKKQDPGAYDMGSGKPVEKEEQTRCQGSLWIECQPTDVDL